MSFHLCSAPGCRVEIRTHFLMCAPHWRRVPGAIRTEVNEAYRKWKDGEIGLDELREVQRRATEALGRVKGGVA